jgi:hypothetical protein
MAVVMPITATTGTSALRKRVHVGDHPRGEALGAGGADIVLLQHLQHAGARDARDERGLADAQRHRRQHHVGERGRGSENTEA